MENYNIIYVNLTQIEIIPGFNVRYDMGDIESLSVSIKEQGILTPLIVKDMNITLRNSDKLYKLLRANNIT